MATEKTDFSDLNNINFHEVELEIKKKKVDYEIEDDTLPNVPVTKPKRKRPSRAKPKIVVDNEVFSDDCTPILGKDIIVLQNKITQYKNLYPKELKSFKVKKNATVQELEEYLKEMETIVTCDGVDEFITDSILQIIRMGELISQPTRFDISGCADMLKSNPQFTKLCKLLYIKYKVYSEIPPEFQLIMVIGTSAYFCNANNRQRKQEI